MGNKIVKLLLTSNILLILYVASKRGMSMDLLILMFLQLFVIIVFYFTEN